MGASRSCPKSFVSDGLMMGGANDLLRGRGPIWSMVEPSSNRQQVLSIIIVQHGLITKLNDAELRALLGLHIGRYMVGPQLPRLWRKAGSWWILHRFYRGWPTLHAAGASLLQQPARRPLKMWRNRHQSKQTAKLIEPCRALGAVIARDATVIQAFAHAAARRNRALVLAADRLAVVAAGSVAAATKALAISLDDAGEQYPLDVRVWHMTLWASTDFGRRVLSESQARLRALRARTLTLASVVLAVRVALSVVAVSLVLLSLLWLSAGRAALSLNALLLASTLVAVAPAAFAAWAAAAGGRAAEQQLVTLASLRDSLLAAAALYAASACLAWQRLVQIRRRGRQTTIESLIHEALPAALEAAAGAALLARSSSSSRRRPLGELDRELRAQWSTALRGLSAKLADLRRLSGASDAPQARGENPAVHLCAKLDLETRRLLGAEVVWMRRALDPGHEGALERVLFWWLHDDGEGGVLGSPRTAGGHPGAEISVLEKLPYPSLSAAGVTPEQLQAGPIDQEEVKHIATVLAEQQRKLDRLLMALRQVPKPSPSCGLGGSRSGGLSPRTAALRATTTAAVETALSGMKRLMCCGRRYGRAESFVRSFLAECEKHSPSCCEAATRPAASCGRYCEVAPPLVLAATLLVSHAAFLGAGLQVGRLGGDVRDGGGGGWVARAEFAIFLWANFVLLRRLRELQLPYWWSRLERCLAALAMEREKLVDQLRLTRLSRQERLAHLKALVLQQGVRTAQNLDYLALCVQAEALKKAAAAEMVIRGGTKKAQRMAAKLDSGMLPKEYIHQCLQLLYAVLPRHGRQGQRLVSSDSDIQMAMAWFDTLPVGSHPEEGFTSSGEPFLAESRLTHSPAQLRSLQVALATSQRQLWMLFRLCDMRSMAPVQGTLPALLEGQLRPIVFERRLKLDALPSLFEQQSSDSLLELPLPPQPRAVGNPDSNRMLMDLDSTSVSNDGESDRSSVTATGRIFAGAAESNDGESDRSSVTGRRILAGSASEASDDRGLCGEDSGGSGGRRSGSDRPADEDASSHDAESFSDTSSYAADGDGMQRILAASDVSDGASSDSASSAGFQSFGITHSSMWSGMSRSNASSTSSLGEDLLAHRRPLLEGYASALRPLFMTRGDLMHLLLKFPAQVLVGGGSANSRGFAAHRELLEELFGSVVVAVKSPERRGKVKLAFGASFSYGGEPYVLGHMQTTLQLVAHGVRRTGHEPFPVVYEDEHEDDERSEVAVSAVRDDVTEHGGGQGVLEFEEVVVPLTEVSSRELFLAELMQSDQCQLLASLSQGSHSKYGHRALRRRRRTLRHVREAAALLVKVPDQ